MRPGLPLRCIKESDKSDREINELKATDRACQWRIQEVTAGRGLEDEAPTRRHRRRGGIWGGAGNWYSPSQPTSDMGSVLSFPSVVEGGPDPPAENDFGTF